MRIVGFVRMRKHAVCERRIDGTADDVRCGYRGDFLALVCASELDRETSRWKFGTGNHRGESVEDDVLGFFDDLLRQFTSAGRTHVCAQRPGDRGFLEDGSLGKGECAWRISIGRAGIDYFALGLSLLSSFRTTIPPFIT